MCTLPISIINGTYMNRTTICKYQDFESSNTCTHVTHTIPCYSIYITASGKYPNRS